MMIELGDDDGVARPQTTPERPCEVKRQTWSYSRRRRFPLGVAFRKSARARRASSRARVGLGTAGKRPVGIGVVVVEIISHRLDHGPRNLRSPGPSK